MQLEDACGMRSALTVSRLALEVGTGQVRPTLVGHAKGFGLHSATNFLRVVCEGQDSVCLLKSSS